MFEIRDLSLIMTVFDKSNKRPERNFSSAGAQLEGAKRAKADFQILEKCSAFIAALSSGKRNFGTL